MQPFPFVRLQLFQRIETDFEMLAHALEKLKAHERERLHSRKLRNFAEVAFQ